MAHYLQTARLYVKQISEQDRSNFALLLQNEEVIKYCFDPLSEKEIYDSFASRLKPWSKDSNHWLCLAMYEKNTEKFVGVNGFRVSKIDRELELGFLLLPKYQGAGYATESVKAVIKYAQDLGFSSVVANVTEGNLACEKVLQKCGLSLIKTEPLAICIANEELSNLVYALSP